MEPGATRKYHDWMNVVLMTVFSVYASISILWPTKSIIPPVGILLYFIVDVGWILFDPEAVKSPSDIINHHLASIGLVLASLWNNGPLRDMWAVGLLVEINTMCLIGSRVWDSAAFVSLTRVTWIPCRICVPLYLVFVLFRNIFVISTPHAILAAISLVGFCYYQIKWSIRYFGADTNKVDRKNL